MLADTAAKVLGRDGAGWPDIAASGLCNVMVPEAAGGFGGGWEDALAVFRQAGLGALAQPVAETVIGSRILAACGVATGDAPVTFVTQAEGEVSESTGFTGTLRNVPWDDRAPLILGRTQMMGEAWLMVLDAASAVSRSTRNNLAGEPRGTLAYRTATVQLARWPAAEAHNFTQMGALARAGQIAGAMEAMLAMTIEHAKTRQQFGRAIGNFQAIQQQLAVFASETAAVGAAAAAAARAADRGDASFEIAAAKLRANRAVDVAASVAHQVHGAIGITKEHALHRYTQRLWSWKSDFGNDRLWADRLGSLAASRGADNFWADLTRPRTAATAPL